MRVMVTGCAGYIGGVLTEILLGKGYDVICIDRLLFGDEGIRDFIGDKRFKLVKEDVRSYDPSVLVGVDAIIDLAAISQPDPTRAIDPKYFHEINYRSSVRTAALGKKHGVERYIFASTCSVYGFQKEIVNESSPTNYLEEYGRTKALAEKEILSLADKSFSPTALRFATNYGLSRKMRYDLLVNGMTLSLYKTGIIKVMRPGTQVRPVVHVRDAAKAIFLVMESERDLVGGEVFNVGSNDQNYEVYQVARLVGESIGVPYKIEWYGEPDTRSYRVDFTKINRILGFKADYTPADGVREIYKALKEGVIADKPEAYVISWWGKLISTGAV